MLQRALPIERPAPASVLVGAGVVPGDFLLQQQQRKNPDIGRHRVVLCQVAALSIPAGLMVPKEYRVVTLVRTSQVNQIVVPATIAGHGQPVLGKESTVVGAMITEPEKALRSAERAIHNGKPIAQRRWQLQSLATLERLNVE